MVINIPVFVTYPLFHPMICLPSGVLIDFGSTGSVAPSFKEASSRKLLSCRVFIVLDINIARFYFWCKAKYIGCVENALLYRELR